MLRLRRYERISIVRTVNLRCPRTNHKTWHVHTEQKRCLNVERSCTYSRSNPSWLAVSFVWPIISILRSLLVGGMADILCSLFILGLLCFQPTGRHSTPMQQNNFLRNILIRSVIFQVLHFPSLAVWSVAFVLTLYYVKWWDECSWWTGFVLLMWCLTELIVNVVL